MWVSSQRSGDPPFAPLIDHRPVQGSLIAIVLVGVLTALAFRVLRRYIMLHRDEHRFARLPRWGIEPRRVEDGVVKGLSVAKIIAALIPVGALVHFFDKVIGRGTLVKCDRTGGIEHVGLWEIPEKLTGHYYCLGQGAKDAAIDGVTFFPLIQPILLILLSCWIAFEFLLAAFRYMQSSGA